MEELLDSDVDMSQQESSEEVLLTDTELNAKMEDAEQLKQALESLSDVYTYVSNSPDSYNVDKARVEVSRIYSSLGMETVSLESLDSSDRRVATETIFENIRDGFSRVINMLLWVDDFLSRKLLWGFKSFKNLVSFIESDIDKAFDNARLLPASTRDIISVNSAIGSHLKTPNGKMLTAAYASEIVTNHTNILQAFLNQKEIISCLHGEDLEYFRKITAEAMRGKTGQKSNFDNTKKNMANDLAKIFDFFKNFRGKPLANGRTLHVEFDKEAPERLVFYKDMFQMSVISNGSAARPYDAKRLNRKEAEDLVKKVKNLHSLYKEVDDYTAHVAFLRQSIYKLQMSQVFVAPAAAILMGGFIGMIVSQGIAIATFIHQISVIIRTIGYTASSLSYYAIRETCNYVKASL